MSNRHDLDDDPFDEQSLHIKGSPDLAPLRQALLQRTSRIVRRRRIARRAGWAAAFAACYFAGMATMSLVWHFSAVAPAIAIGERSTPAQQEPATDKPPVEQESAPVEVVVAVRAPRSSPKRQSPFEILRAAGDRSLSERGDFRAAITCYRQAVKQATREELEEMTADEHFLLQSLKQDRLQEVDHDNRNG